MSLEPLIINKAKTQANGPLRQATGPPRSDAGVGIGILRGFLVSWKSQRFEKMISRKYKESTRIKQMIFRTYQESTVINKMIFPKCQESTRIVKSLELSIKIRYLFKKCNSLGFAHVWGVSQNFLRFENTPKRLFDICIKNARR